MGFGYYWVGGEGSLVWWYGAEIQKVVDAVHANFGLYDVFATLLNLL